MSRVYLQEIPNAPQSVGGGVMMRADVRVPSLGNVAGSLLQAKIPQGPLTVRRRAWRRWRADWPRRGRSR